MDKEGKIHLGLIGTDSLRGKEIKNVLERSPFPFSGLDFFDPEVEGEYSRLTQFRNEPKVITAASEEALTGIDLLFLASDKKVNHRFGRLAAQKEIVMIDLEESFTGRKDVPVIVAGINAEKVLRLKPKLIANPHPAALMLAHIFKALQGTAGVARAAAHVLQPVSAYGEAGIRELADQSLDMLGSAGLTKKVFKAQIAFNLLSQVSPVDKQGFSALERQILREIREIMEARDFPLSVALLQAPVFHAYSVMLYLELEEAVTKSRIEESLKAWPTLKFAPPSQSGPVSVVSAAGQDKILVGQLKQEKTRPQVIWIWAAADNLTRCSALNAYEIARIIAAEFLPAERP